MAGLTPLLLIQHVINQDLIKQGALGDHAGDDI